MKTYHSIYLGICVQNNDPEYRGRIKVWVPHINGSIYNKWAALKQDRSFKFPGVNVDSDLNLVLDSVKDVLPWAEYCGPLAGESSTGYYNAHDRVGTVSDAAYPYSLSGSNYTNNYSQFNLNNEQMGEKPGFVYEKYATRLKDAFTDTTANNTNQVNPTGNQYRPSTYSNAAKGIFSIPNVGAQVWVFFRDGVPFYPVYIGTSLGQDDFASIFKSEDGTYQDYPQTFESVNSNLRSQDDVNTNTYRNKMVLNQRGASIEIINTTDRESFKITHFAGGFLEFNNKYNSLFSPENIQFLTLKDSFETVNGFSNSFVGRDSDNIIQGDFYLKTGNLNQSAMNSWLAAYSPIATFLAENEGSKSGDLTSIVTTQGPLLATAEAQLGEGGNYIETITKHKFVNVGLVFNNFASSRYNATAKTVTQYRNATSTGTTLATTTIPAIEYTHIDDMPGGNYTVTAGNRYNVLVGAGGIDIKTTGPVNLGGTIMAVAGKQVNIASTDDTNIDGGSNLSVIATLMTLRTRNRGQVVIDDNLGISQNVVVGGGEFINGEAFVQHITAPVEFQLSEATKIAATDWNINGVITGGSPSGSGGTFKVGDPIVIGPNSGSTLAINTTHQHYYKNIPLTMLASNNAVSTAAEALNGGSSTQGHSAVTDGYKADPGGRTPPSDPRTN
jgi:hypothetical protein